MTPDKSKDVEDYLVDNDGNKWKLSHHNLKKTYSNEEKDRIDCSKRYHIFGEVGYSASKACSELYKAVSSYEKEKW
jgi:hypothetical protein